LVSGLGDKKGFPENEAGFEAGIFTIKVRSSIKTLDGRQTVFRGSPGFRGKLLSVPKTHFQDNESNKYRFGNF
jgi:hypothetical protein